MDSKELDLINQYTKRRFSADEVYTFSVVLCDNEIDRDFECFDSTSLEKLAEMYIARAVFLTTILLLKIRPQEFMIARLKLLTES